MAWGETIRLDTARLTLKAEAAALIAGIHTYELTRMRNAYPIRRRVYHIETGYPRYGFIHARHLCGMHWNAEPKFIDTRKLFDTYDGNDPPF